MAASEPLRARPSAISKKCPLHIDDEASMEGDVRKSWVRYLWYIEVLTGSSGAQSR